jgi:hypothetical protein
MSKPPSSELESRLELELNNLDSSESFKSSELIC